jgi:hypothetical protein
MDRTRRDLASLAEDVAAVGRRGLARDDYFAEVGARLKRVVDCDALCWHTLDPATADGAFAGRSTAASTP